MLKLKKYWWILLLAIVVIGLVAFNFLGGKKETFETHTVIRGDIEENVFVTGATKPSVDVALSFESSGRIYQVLPVVGTQVRQGQLLASLDTRELNARLLQADASLRSAQATLNDLVNGTRPEEIAIKQEEVEKNKIAVSDAAVRLSSRISNAFTVIDNNIRTNVDSLFTDPETSNPKFNINSVDAQKSLDLIQSRIKASAILKRWMTLRQSIDSNRPEDLIETTNDMFTDLNEIRKFFDSLAVVVNSLAPSSTLSESAITTYKANISKVRIDLDSVVDDLLVHREKLTTAQSILSISNNELILAKAGATTESVNIQKARVDQAKADKDILVAQIEKTKIISPIAGVVTKVDAKSGETALSGTPLIFVSSQVGVEIEANVPEVSIGRVSIGNNVEIVLDAISGEVFTGRVVHIDPAETKIDGVSNFKVTVIFDKNDPRFKSGLTANLDIKTNKKTNVLLVPEDYLFDISNSSAYVEKKNAEMFQKTEVKIGIRNGNAEIASGLIEGDILRKPAEQE